MTSRQFGLAGLLLGVTVCALVFAAARIFPNAALGISFILFGTAGMLLFYSVLVIAIVGIVSDWRAMPRPMRIWNAALVAILVFALFVGFAIR